MRFKNITTDDLAVAGVFVKAGELTPELTDDEALGFVEQTTVWAPVKAPKSTEESK